MYSFPFINWMTGCPPRLDRPFNLPTAPFTTPSKMSLFSRNRTGQSTKKRVSQSGRLADKICNLFLYVFFTVDKTYFFFTWFVLFLAIQFDNFLVVYLF